MTRFFRIAALWLLTACVAATSVTTAVARSAAQGHYSVVICGLEGVVQITLDAQGNPVGPMHPCPDCVVIATATLPSGTEAPARVQRMSLLAPVAPPAPRWLSHVLEASARGPPFAV
jgi:hypothetical protein